ncbi:hypothetical protein VT84_30870 [Gemmata sp. SH-PL17]|uniref:hypothetical protein n=1 Tax=Gemmata sp. SH-PL17 TaxID=1630693 RepID=UPI00078BCE70|nr:hypothetical protein [Gemmata sp. SH-PL17]AMV28837.1 hypothetical protein VT84_30870 [Gemmata sp. SH-PL17]
MSSRRPPWIIALVGFAFGVALVTSAGTRTAIAQPKAPAIVPAPQAPTLTTPATLGAKPGDEVELTLTGTNLADAIGVTLGCPAKITIPGDNKNGTDAGKFRVKVAVDPKCAIGLYTVRVATKNGVSNARPFLVDTLPLVASTGANRAKDTAQAVTAPCVASGVVASETSEFYKVKVDAGQKLAFEVLARRIGSPLDPIVVLHDAKTKRELISLYADDTPGMQGDCRLAHTFKDAGEVLVEVRDTTHRGGGDFFYRLRIGDFPGATTAYPLAAERGKSVSVGFSGPDTIPAVSTTAPKDPSVAAFYAVPTTGKDAGWPVPVLLTDYPQATEQEPNDEPAKANKLPVPGGVSARFDKAKDMDHFAITGKKGQKLVISVATFEVNAPTEVLVRVLDAKGGEVARSNPAAPVNRLEFTPPADGEYILACEQQNFLNGPNEVYYLSVAPAGPDFSVALAFDRAEVPVGGSTGVLATVTRLNGFAGAVDLSIDGDAALSGKVTLPANQTIVFVPLQVKEGAKAGAHPFRVKATAVGDTTVTRYGTLLDAVRAGLSGMPNPPAELLNQCAVGVVEKPPFVLKATFAPTPLEKGKPSKLLLDATRGEGAGEDIVIAPLFLPPTIVPAVKPIAKGQTKGEIGLTVQPATPVGSTQLVFRATTKAGGKDYAFTVITTADVIEAKKEEPKKDPPKKEEPKKDPPKKEEPKKDVPKKEEPKKDVKKEEPKKDAPKKEEPKKDVKKDK